jgi:8-oxo-dGTP pyrophosphatase MutT (NUDIX family)
MSPDPAPWKPAVTVAAVIEHDGRFLLVEEETSAGVRINQPAGHLDPGESLIDACVRETLEETAFAFTPLQLLGVYLWRADGRQGSTYLRFAFTGVLGERDAGRRLDDGILRTLWLTTDELAARAAAHRSPLVMQCVDDYLRGQRYPLALLHAHASALQALAANPR